MLEIQTWFHPQSHITGWMSEVSPLPVMVLGQIRGGI
jgi:hypothetical protein